MTTATRKASIEARLDAIAAELEAIDTTKAGGLPERSGAAVNVKHVGYRLSLVTEYEKLTAILTRLKSEKQADGGDVGIEESEEWSG